MDVGSITVRKRTYETMKLYVWFHLVSWFHPKREREGERNLFLFSRGETNETHFGIYRLVSWFHKRKVGFIEP